MSAATTPGCCLSSITLATETSPLPVTLREQDALDLRHNERAEWHECKAKHKDNKALMAGESPSSDVRKKRKQDVRGDKK